MTNLLLTALLVLAAPEFQATTLDGKSTSGALTELNAERAVLQTTDGPATFELAKIATLSRASIEDAATKKGTLSVVLVDDSTLAATEYTVKDAKASVVLASGTRLEVPTRTIRSVRFTQPDAKDDPLGKQWSEIASTRASGDLLIVRKGGQLDFLEGVAKDMEAERLNFEVDGEVIRVNREKIEGLVYFHPGEQNLPEAAGRVSAADGSSLSIHTATLVEGTIQIATPAGVSLTLVPEAISRFDFTAGKLAYLSDLDAESATYEPYFGFEKELPILSDYYAYRRDIGFENERLALDGATYAKGLALQSRTVLVYKLPGKFRLFKATVGIDDSVRRWGNAKVEIKADGKSIWQADIRGADPPRDLELDIQGAKRLSIEANFGDQLDIGDRVDFCDARVTK
jgi:hypothetical protein